VNESLCFPWIFLRPNNRKASAITMMDSTPKITISNFFYMLVYAWSHYKPEQLKLFGKENFDKPVNFLSSLLCQTVNENIIYNLAAQHQRRTERLRTVRGRIELQRTLLSPDWKAGVVVCNHPVVAANTLENQLIKATLRQLSIASDLTKTQRAEARRLCTKLTQVSDIALARSAFRRTIVDRSMRRYRFPLAICELLIDQMLVSDGSGRTWFANYVRNEVAMRKLFEAFVVGLIRHKLIGPVQVGGRTLAPFMVNIENGDGSLIPSMRTDVTVRVDSKILIIDTKYTPRVFQEHYGNQTVRSEHFYQIQAYTEHSSAHFPNHEVSGMVLYPKAGADLDLSFQTKGRKYSFCTIDLAQDWRGVEHDLLELVQDCVQ
jgi:5-methylcytosine-specific restriction enzyme subunit McrC